MQSLSFKLEERWKQELQESFSNVQQLLDAGLIVSSESEKLAKLGDQFRVRITPYYASLMTPSPHCPIRQQAIPSLGEHDPALPSWAVAVSQEVYQRDTPWHADPIGDIQNLAAPRLTHRYSNRAILHLSSLCAVYCRFCFRKSHLNDSERTLYEGSLEPSFEYLEKHPEIQELILTGGDPLSVTDSALAKLLDRIGRISHIRTLRIHSRMAVTLPFRFTSNLIQILSQERSFNVVLVSHFNHPRELTHDSRSALNQLRRAGITLLNQSVLLKGVNADPECLTELFQGLYEIGVISFYLHHPDWTPGTFQFRVSIEQGREIVSKLRGLLSGPALPEYILDIPQGHGKISLMNSNIKKIQQFQDSEIQGTLYEIQSPQTRSHRPTRNLYLDLYLEKSPKTNYFLTAESVGV